MPNADGMRREKLLLAVEELYEEWGTLGWLARADAGRGETTELFRKMQKVFVAASSLDEDRMTAAFKRGAEKRATGDGLRLPRAHRSSA
jgi:hypothetical protein